MEEESSAQIKFQKGLPNAGGDTFSTNRSMTFLQAAIAASMVDVFLEAERVWVSCSLQERHHPCLHCTDFQQLWHVSSSIRN
jgi:hypothetical protein